MGIFSKTSINSQFPRRQRFYIIFFLSVLAFFTFFLIFTIFLYRPNLSAIIEIKKGASFNQIAEDLEERGVILDDFWFKAYAWFRGEQSDIKAGRYELGGRLSANDVLRILVEGGALSDDIEVVIPEGFNVWEIDKKLIEAGLVKKGEFIKIALNKEGYLFPDTYKFEPGSGINAILSKFELNFANKIRDLGSQITPEIISIASILEKEVKTTQDMQIVAGIIQKRLAAGMSLEIDATVAYGVCLDGERLPSAKIVKTFFDGVLCDVSLVPIRDYLNFESPFNTYKRLGLPPTPISNPGIRAVQAALSPIDSPYFYYLSPRDGGPTIFSKTLQEHLVARRKYLNL